MGKKKGGKQPVAPGGSGPPPGPGQQQGGSGPPQGQGQQQRGSGPPPGQDQQQRGSGPPPGQKQQQGGYGPPPGQRQQQGGPGGFGPHQGQRPPQGQPSGFTPQAQQREEGGPAQFGPPPGQRQQPGGSGGLPPQRAPVWGNKPNLPPQEPPVQQAVPTQPAQPPQPKGKGRGRGPAVEQQAPLPAPAATPAAAAPPAQQKAQPTPAEGKPGGTQPKGKGRGRGPAVEQQAPLPAPAATPAAAAPPAQQKVQPTPAEGKPGGKKQKGKAKETQKAQTAPTPTPAPSASGVGDTTEKVQKMTLQVFDLPKRKVREIVHAGPYVQRKILIEVNYLPLKIKDPKLRIYHYDVNFNPDKPKYLLRKAMNKMREKCFSNRYPAFDGNKNLYVAGKPLNANNTTIRDSVTVYNHETGKDKEFDITIKIANDNLTIAKLFEYCNHGVTSNIPQTEIQATDIALRSGLVDNFTAAGRSFFAKGHNPVDLSGGFELWHGFYQSAIAAWKPYLNIDVANKAFPIEQTVMNFMCNAFRCQEPDFRDYELSSQEKVTLERYIKGLKISYDMPTPHGVQKRIYKVTGLGGSPITERFRPKDDGPMISVGQYYQKEKNYMIKYPKLPLLKIGTQGSMVPLELCTIIGNQAVMRKLDENQTAVMVKNAARPTTERKQRIVANIQRARFNSNPTLNEFGIQVEENFERVEAVIMNPPTLAYNSNNVNPQRGVWQIPMRDNFKAPSGFPEWAVLNLNERTYPQKISELEKLMGQVGQSLGMRVPRPQQGEAHRGYRISQPEVENYLMKLGGRGVRLVVVVLSNADDIYGIVKRASELRTGILTQCIKSRTVDRINAMTVTNILLKVNSKLRGVNHCLADVSKPPFLNAPCMFVGADVTHPAPGSGAEATPSIAAVAASHDSYGFQYKMLYRLQGSREEMIVDLANIMKEQLQSFIKTTTHEPRRILYFRDGVSEGQFQQVLNVELLAIRRACSMIRPDYTPAITFLVVQKRHHTRFFPNARDGDPKNCNVPAGTLVDKQITHPTEMDFYLVSHQSIQGTARPTKYHVLWDDNNFTQVDLEKLTYYLCHMFARCTRAVSYPAPTYYAHLAAFRARAWWDRLSPRMGELRQEQERRGTISANILDNYPMFFT